MLAVTAFAAGAGWNVFRNINTPKIHISTGITSICSTVIGATFISRIIPPAKPLAVAPKPYRALKAEAAIAGKPVNEANAEAAGAAAVQDATPLNATKYKVQIAKTLVKRALLATV